MFRWRDLDDLIVTIEMMDYCAKQWTCLCTTYRDERFVVNGTYRFDRQHNYDFHVCI